MGDRRTGGVYAFLSKWTKIDHILGAYSQPIFEKLARRYYRGPVATGVAAIVSLVLALGMVTGAGALSAVVGKPFYLDAYGTEAAGTVTDLSFHTNSYRHRQRRETIRYEFTTRDAAKIAARLDRPALELSGIPDQSHFTVLYWERFPSVNMPRGYRVQMGIILFLMPIFVLAALTFALLSWRLFRWRQNPSDRLGEDGAGCLTRPAGEAAASRCV
jgi:hypothetical protein